LLCVFIGQRQSVCTLYSEDPRLLIVPCNIFFLPL
jgi:hypothetical protein